MSTINLRNNTISNIINKDKSDITHNLVDKYPKKESKILSLPISQWILVLYNFLFLSIVSFIVVFDWGSTLQLPKSGAFILGITLFLFLASMLWIFGFIKHSVNINLGDIIIVIFGILVLIITLLNPDKTAFWGSTVRIFDSGLFLVSLIIFYVLIKIFLETKSLNIVILFFSILNLLGGVLAVMAIYIPNVSELIPVLKQFQSTGSWITESPQELILLNLISINIVFITLIYDKYKTFNRFILSSIYYIFVIVNILLVIRTPEYTMYIVLMITFVIHSILYISNLSKSNQYKDNIKLQSNKISFIYGVLIVFLLALMLIRPFQNNTKFLEYPVVIKPNLNTSLSIAKQTLQSDTLLGVGNIKYAWDQFKTNSDDATNQDSNFSFETLFNELINLIVRYGGVVTIILALFGIWLILSFLRIILIQKTIPLEIYPLWILIVGLFLMPFAVVTKILLILTLVLWNSIFTKYFKPIIKFELDTNKIPSSISSLCTFIVLFILAGSVFVASNILNLVRSQEYVLKASQIKDNQAEQLNLLKMAKEKSPNYIEYTNLYMPQFIQQINKEALELAIVSQQSETRNIDADKQKLLQESINEAQRIIDEYKKNFPSDNRVIYWQLDLYSVINQYGTVKESDYLDNVNLGKKLQPNSINWDIYKAQYYAKQAQKEKDLNQDQFNKAKDILSSLLEKNKYSLEVYKNYYELLSLNKDYNGQIDILSKYIDLSIQNNFNTDKDMVYNLALAYQNNNQYDEAIKYYNRLLEVFPDYTNVHFKLGEIYEAQKKNDLAIKQYQKVLELDPKAELARTKLEQLK